MWFQTVVMIQRTHTLCEVNTAPFFTFVVSDHYNSCIVASCSIFTVL